MTVKPRSVRTNGSFAHEMINRVVVQDNPSIVAPMMQQLITRRHTHTVGSVQLLLPNHIMMMMISEQFLQLMLLLIVFLRCSDGINYSSNDRLSRAAL
uniref:Uncharacterized protein n=1 Tax=Strigamia maritima TaxID=126957 RepID=T1J0X7_STRMM